MAHLSLKASSMRILSLALALCLATPAFAAEPSPVQTPEQKQQDISWMELTCRTQGKQACLMAYGWHWMRKANVMVDPALKTLAASTGVYTVALLIKHLGGDVAATEYVLMAARTGIKAGAYVLIGTAVFTVVATLATAGSFLLQSTTSTAKPEDDDLLVMCRVRLDWLSKHGGLGEISRLTPEEMQQLLPCLPKESELARTLAGIGEQAMALDHAGNSSF